MLGLAFWEKGRASPLEHYEGADPRRRFYLRVLGQHAAHLADRHPRQHRHRLSAGALDARAGQRARMIVLALVVLPFWVSILVRTRLDRRAGQRRLVNRGLMWLGLTDAPISFLYNELGVTIGMANVLLPFLVLPLFAAMIPSTTACCRRRPA